MNTLVIEHTSGTNQFRVIRLPDCKRTTQPAAITPPDQYPVEGRPNSQAARFAGSGRSGDPANTQERRVGLVHLFGH